MIKIPRAPEPAELAMVRDSGLTRARAASTSGGKFSFEGYGVAKDDLFAMQHHKCCYCEKVQEQAKYRDVEHYRPKADYWWLAWTWENLLFACLDCNREHKRDQFPLAEGSERLVAEQAPPGLERPLVINPSDSDTDPMEEIEFRRIRIHGRERWEPVGRTPRGWKTIEVCGLDRASLLDRYGEHVTHVVRPKLEPVTAAIRSGRAQDIVRTWSTASRGLLGPTREFRALSHDALAVLVPFEIRQRYQLELERPR